MRDNRSRVTSMASPDQTKTGSIPMSRDRPARALLRRHGLDDGPPPAACLDPPRMRRHRGPLPRSLRRTPAQHADELRREHADTRAAPPPWWTARSFSTSASPGPSSSRVKRLLGPRRRRSNASTDASFVVRRRGHDRQLGVTVIRETDVSIRGSNLRCLVASSQTVNAHARHVAIGLDPVVLHTVCGPVELRDHPHDVAAVATRAEDQAALPGCAGRVKQLWRPAGNPELFTKG